ncbi:MAG: hypothetical protein M1823_002282 [Watsoniomyces obsoletus]|nr:MAG: hypothetical protein M1823_002282 [Watsoniomyces obsoletus]
MLSLGTRKKVDDKARDSQSRRRGPSMTSSLLSGNTSTVGKQPSEPKRVKHHRAGTQRDSLEKLPKNTPRNSRELTAPTAVAPNGVTPRNPEVNGARTDVTKASPKLQTPPASAGHNVFSYLLDSSTVASTVGTPTSTGPRSSRTATPQSTVQRPEYFPQLAPERPKPPLQNGSSSSVKKNSIPRVRASNAPRPALDKVFSDKPIAPDPPTGDKWSPRVSLHDAHPEVMSSGQQFPVQYPHDGEVMPETKTWASSYMQHGMPNTWSGPSSTSHSVETVQYQAPTTPLPPDSGQQTKAEPSKGVFRKFSHLNHRLLSHLQHQLTQLEAELEMVDALVRTDRDTNNALQIEGPAAAQGLLTAHPEHLQWRQADILSRLEVTLSKYNHALSSYNLVRNLSKPSEDDVQSFQLHTEHRLFGEVGREPYIDDASELVDLKLTTNAGPTMLLGETVQLHAAVFAILFLVPLLLFRLIPGLIARLVTSIALIAGVAGFLHFTSAVPAMNTEIWTRSGLMYMGIMVLLAALT